MNEDRKNHKLSEEMIMAQGIGFFIAGFETSSNTMSTLCYNLAVNEEVQEKLYQEICSVIEGKSRVRILYDHFTTLGLVFRFAVPGVLGSTPG